MKIVFDSTKDRINIAKHGIALAEAINIEWELIQVQLDVRHDYGEIRVVGYAPIGTRVFCVVFTDRDNERRIISLRKANSREVKRYASKI